MNDERSEYLRQAAFCRGMAAEANTLERKAAWLRLASKWLALMAEDFEPVVRDERASRSGKDPVLERAQEHSNS